MSAQTDPTAERRAPTEGAPLADPILLDAEPEPRQPDATRQAALDLADWILAPAAVPLSKAAALVGTERERSARARSAAAEVPRRERAVKEFGAGQPGSLVLARNTAQAALDRLGEIAAAERAALDLVKGDPDLSESGRARKRKATHAAFDADRAREVATGLDLAESHLAARSDALGQGWAQLASATKPRTDTEQLVATLRVSNLLAASGGVGSEERLGELILIVAESGDGATAAELLGVYARTARDLLCLDGVTRALRSRSDIARSAQLLASPERLAIAAERWHVDRARDGLRAVRSFVGTDPLEADLARQRLAAAFRDLGSA